MTPEGQIKKDIMDWLNAQPGCFAQSIQVGKIPGRRNLTRGVSDILGTWNGLAFAIEVKAAKGKLSPDQETFITSWTIRGRGISIVARDVGDVVRVFCSTRIQHMVIAIQYQRVGADAFDFRGGPPCSG